MKFRRRITSFVLAALLICLTAMPASAASSTMFGDYNGSTWETSDICNLLDYSSTTYYEDHSSILYSKVTAYCYGLLVKPDGTVYPGEYSYRELKGPESRIASTLEGYTRDPLTKIICKHYVDNINVYTCSVLGVW